MVYQCVDMNYQALYWESRKETNDSLEIMCWNIDKEIGDNQNKDFAFHKQTKDKLCVDIVGGGRFNEIELER